MPNKHPINKIDAQTVMKINGRDIKIRADDLITISELGRGAYGVVEKVKYLFVYLNSISLYI